MTRKKVKPNKQHVSNESQAKISSFFKKPSVRDDQVNNPSVEIASSSTFKEESGKKRKFEDTSDSDDSISKIRKCMSTTYDYKAVETKNVHKTLKNRSVEKSASSGEHVLNEILNCDIAHNERSPDSTVKSLNYNVKESSEKVDKNNSQETTSKPLSDISNKIQERSKESQSQPHCCDNSSVVIKNSDNARNIVHENDIMEGFDDFFDPDSWMPNNIDFSTFQRCRVIRVLEDRNIIILSLKHATNGSTGTVQCSGVWKFIRIKVDDTVSVRARKQSEEWVIDNEDGYLIINPDILVANTTITGSVFCSRRSALADKFRKVESLPYNKSDETVMRIGSLVHELFQKALTQNLHEPLDIIELMDGIIHSKDTIYSLYASDISIKRCQQNMDIYVPKIAEFIKHYVKNETVQSISNEKVNFKGTISQIHDIEENIWLPTLGIKGKIDVTAEVQIHGRRKLLPLEMKTGRPTFSIEHRGQIILYIMMMEFIGEKPDAGLLLYLRDNLMKELKSTHSEQRDLIFLRNTLAYYFRQKDTILSPMELPDPINHRNACTKCVYSELCCAYLKKDKSIELKDSHPLLEISKEVLRDVTSVHIDYVLKWVALMHMEEEDRNDSDNKISNMWLETPENREAKGTCISNLKIIGEVTEKCGKYRHTFVRVDKEKTCKNLTQTQFYENEYIVMSTGTRINVSSGFVADLGDDSVVVLLDRDVTKRYADATFCIDKYFSSNLLLAMLGNVGGLLSDSAICAKLRNIVIDRKPTTYVEKLPRSTVSLSAKILGDLNENQQRAVLKAIAANEYILIKGMPGTGKTQTLVALIRLLHEMGRSVLVTAHTHSAVDNILMKLVAQDVDVLRLGSSTTIHPSLSCKTEEYLTTNCRSPEDLDSVYNSKNIVGVTCFGAYHMLLGKRTFDVCIVDESAQILQPVVLRPLYNANKFVLAGDPDQLPPIIRNAEVRNLGGEESLFHRLDNSNNTVILQMQYRMNKTIMDLANNLTYDGKLQVGSELIANATLSSLSPEVLSVQKKWIKRAFSRELDESVIVLNTGSTYDLKSSEDIIEKYGETDQVYSNIWETAVIVSLVQLLVKANLSPSNIGIIAPYTAHIKLLRKCLGKDVEVNTVDQYQGRDKEVILYSCVRSVSAQTNISQNFEILEDHRRLTVAISRAKQKLIIIGDKSTTERYTPFKKLFQCVEKDHIIDLNNEEYGFDWKDVLSSL